MPRWAVVVMAGLAVLAAAAILLEGAVIFALITQDHVNQTEICRLYLALHRDQAIHVAIPPRCR
jgi:hypothetical protein